MGISSEDRIGGSGIILMMVLFILLFVVRLQQPVSPETIPSNYQLKSEMSSGISRAMAPEAIQMPAIEKSCFQYLHCDRILLPGDAPKILAENLKVKQNLNLLAKQELKIKSLLTRRWVCLHLPPADTEELPVLS